MSVQLGEVEITEDEVPPASPPKRRRWTLVMSVWAAIGLTAAMARHGAGVVTLDVGEIGVVRAAPGAPFVGDRVVESAGTHLYVPVLQTCVRVPAHAQSTAISGVARSRRGAAVPYGEGAVHHRVRAADVETLLTRIGPDIEARERFVRAATARAIRLAVGAREATDLRDAAPIHTTVRTQLERLLDANGVELVRYVPPSWRVDPAMSAAMTRLSEVRTSAHRHREDIGQRKLAAEAKRTQTEEERAGAHIAMRTELETQLENARAALTEARRAADLQLERRVRAAAMQREAIVARAKGEEAVVRLEAQALAARVDAVRGRGANLLDKAIAEHVLPQLGQHVGGEQ